MSATTGIQWTDTTENIHVVVDEDGSRHGWWCRHVTPECTNCYAEALNQIGFFGGNGLPYAGEPPVLKLREDIIKGWARKKKPKKRFVESMSDCFGEWLPRTWIFIMLDGMFAAPHQTFQMLTKRAAIALREIKAWLTARGLKELPSHMQIGVTAGLQSSADAFIPILLDIPAAVRFVSCEPLLGGVDLSPWLGRGIHWVIVGGKSGKNARPTHPEWPLSLRDQCVAAGVAFFHKQNGEWVSCESIGVRSWQFKKTRDGRSFVSLIDAPRHLTRKLFEACYPFSGTDRDVSVPIGADRNNSIPIGTDRDNSEQFGPLMIRIGKKAAGRLLAGREWNQFPEVRP
jgi:protein gp37